MVEPRATAWPAATTGSTGSYVVRRPSAWPMLTTGRPATMPANTTTPSPAARATAAGAPARSTPRCPGPYGEDGGSNGRVTRGGSPSGETQSARNGVASAGSAVAELDPDVPRTRARSRTREAARTG